MATTTRMEGARELERSEWASWFHALDKRIERDGLELEASIEVAAPDIDGTEAEHLPLDSTYTFIRLRPARR